jgi:predicted dehydrogenase
MLYAQDGASRELSITGVDGYADEVRYFVECCRAGSKPALCPPAESADAVKMMRLIEEARARSGEKIECRI